MNMKIKSWTYGVLAVLTVLLINFLVIYSLNFPSMAMDIISKYWILIGLLIGGFGIQVGLFTYFNGLNAISCSTTMTSGSISGVSMILCCSHYLLNILPFLGAIVGISFLTKLSYYTPHFLVIGVMSNFLGIGVLFYQKNKYGGKK